MNIKTKKYFIVKAFRKYLEGDALVNFEKDFYKIVDVKSDKLFVSILLKHLDIELLKNDTYKNDYLIYNLLKYDFDGNKLNLSKSKLMDLYLKREKII